MELLGTTYFPQFNVVSNNTVLIVCCIYGALYSLYNANIVRQEIMRPSGARCACATSIHANEKY